MKIAGLTEFVAPAAGATSGLLLSKTLPSILKIESNTYKGLLNAATGTAVIYAGFRKSGALGDLAFYAGISLIAVGFLEVLKGYLPPTWTSGISAYPSSSYSYGVGAYPADIARSSAPALPESFGEPEFGDIAYPYESTVSY